MRSICLQNLRFVPSAVTEILGGSQNLKVGHMTQTTLPCDLILYFWISTSWFPDELWISTWLDLLFWRYCCWKILAFWLENAYSGLFLAVFGDSDPLNCDIVVLTHNGMQLTQKHALWDITRQNWSSGLTPSCADEQTKKQRPLTFHPFVGVTPWTDWHAIWGIEWCPWRNHQCQILCKSVKGFLRGSTPKCAISYTYSNDPYNSSVLPCRLWCTSLSMWFIIPCYHKTFILAVLEWWLIYDCETKSSFVYLIFVLLLYKFNQWQEIATINICM